MTARHGTRTRYVKGPAQDGTPGRGCLCPPCTRAGAEYRDRRARAVAYGRWEYQPDATGTRRRIEALVWCGWSLARLSARLGDDPSHARKILRSQRVTAATERAVRALYDELWDQAPPQDGPYDQRAAVRARNYARKHRFAPPLAWDDDSIDDPAAAAADWKRSSSTQWRAADLAAEAQDLARFGYTQDQAAERLGTTRAALAKAIERTRKAAA